MDPYIKIRAGHNLFKTQVCNRGGKHPFWNDSFNLRRSTEATIEFDIWDEDTFKSDDFVL